MARLTSMPELAIVDKLKGHVDFYYCRGVPCARAWPHWPKRQPTPDERANQDLFTQAVKLASLANAQTRDAYRAMAAGTPWTWRDLFIRSYMRGDITILEPD